MRLRRRHAKPYQEYYSAVVECPNHTLVSTQESTRRCLNPDDYGDTPLLDLEREVHNAAGEQVGTCKVYFELSDRRPRLTGRQVGPYMEVSGTVRGLRGGTRRACDFWVSPSTGKPADEVATGADGMRLALHYLDHCEAAVLERPEARSGWPSIGSIRSPGPPPHCKPQDADW